MRPMVAAGPGRSDDLSLGIGCSQSEDEILNANSSYGYLSEEDVSVVAAPRGKGLEKNQNIVRHLRELAKHSPKVADLIVEQSDMLDQKLSEILQVADDSREESSPKRKESDADSLNAFFAESRDGITAMSSSGLEEQTVAPVTVLPPRFQNVPTTKPVRRPEASSDEAKSYELTETLNSSMSQPKHIEKQASESSQPNQVQKTGSDSSNKLEMKRSTSYNASGSNRLQQKRSTGSSASNASKGSKSATASSRNKRSQKQKQTDSNSSLVLEKKRSADSNSSRRKEKKSSATSAKSQVDQRETVSSTVQTTRALGVQKTGSVDIKETGSTLSKGSNGSAHRVMRIVTDTKCSVDDSIASPRVVLKGPPRSIAPGRAPSPLLVRNPSPTPVAYTTIDVVESVEEADEDSVETFELDLQPPPRNLSRQESEERASAQATPIPGAQSDSPDQPMVQPDDVEEKDNNLVNGPAQAENEEDSLFTESVQVEDGEVAETEAPEPEPEEQVKPEIVATESGPVENDMLPTATTGLEETAEISPRSKSESVAHSTRKNKASAKRRALKKFLRNHSTKRARKKDLTDRVDRVDSEMEGDGVAEKITLLERVGRLSTPLRSRFSSTPKERETPLERETKGVPDTSSKDSADRSTGESATTYEESVIQKLRREASPVKRGRDMVSNALGDLTHLESQLVAEASVEPDSEVQFDSNERPSLLGSLSGSVQPAVSREPKNEASTRVVRILRRAATPLKKRFNYQEDGDLDVDDSREIADGGKRNSIFKRMQRAITPSKIEIDRTDQAQAISQDNHQRELEPPLFEGAHLKECGGSLIQVEDIPILLPSESRNSEDTPNVMVAESFDPSHTSGKDSVQNEVPEPTKISTETSQQKSLFMFLKRNPAAKSKLQPQQDEVDDTGGQEIVGEKKRLFKRLGLPKVTRAPAQKPQPEEADLLVTERVHEDSSIEDLVNTVSLDPSIPSDMIHDTEVLDGINETEVCYLSKCPDVPTESTDEDEREQIDVKEKEEANITFSTTKNSQRSFRKSLNRAISPLKSIRRKTSTAPVAQVPNESEEQLSTIDEGVKTPSSRDHATGEAEGDSKFVVNVICSQPSENEQRTVPPSQDDVIVEDAVAVSSGGDRTAMKVETTGQRNGHAASTSLFGRMARVFSPTKSRPSDDISKENGDIENNTTQDEHTRDLAALVPSDQWDDETLEEPVNYTPMAAQEVNEGDYLRANDQRSSPHNTDLLTRISRAFSPIKSRRQDENPKSRFSHQSHSSIDNTTGEEDGDPEEVEPVVLVPLDQGDVGTPVATQEVENAEHLTAADCSNPHGMNILTRMSRAFSPLKSRGHDVNPKSEVSHQPHPQSQCSIDSEQQEVEPFLPSDQWDHETEALEEPVDRTSATEVAAEAEQVEPAVLNPSDQWDDETPEEPVNHTPMATQEVDEGDYLRTTEDCANPQNMNILTRMSRAFSPIKGGRQDDNPKSRAIQQSQSNIDNTAAEEVIAPKEVEPVIRVPSDQQTDETLEEPLKHTPMATEEVNEEDYLRTTEECSNPHSVSVLTRMSRAFSPIRGRRQNDNPKSKAIHNAATEVIIGTKEVEPVVSVPSDEWDGETLEEPIKHTPMATEEVNEEDYLRTTGEYSTPISMNLLTRISRAFSPVKTRRQDEIPKSKDPVAPTSHDGQDHMEEAHAEAAGASSPLSQAEGSGMPEDCEDALRNTMPDLEVDPTPIEMTDTVRIIEATDSVEPVAPNQLQESCAKATNEIIDHGGGGGGKERPQSDDLMTRISKAFSPTKPRKQQPKPTKLHGASKDVHIDISKSASMGPESRKLFERPTSSALLAPNIETRDQRGLDSEAPLSHSFLTEDEGSFVKSGVDQKVLSEDGAEVLHFDETIARGNPCIPVAAMTTLFSCDCREEVSSTTFQMGSTDITAGHLEASAGATGSFTEESHHADARVTSSDFDTKDPSQSEQSDHLLSQEDMQFFSPGTLSKDLVLMSRSSHADPSVKTPTSAGAPKIEVTASEHSRTKKRSRKGFSLRLPKFKKLTTKQSAETHTRTEASSRAAPMKTPLAAVSEKDDDVESTVSVANDRIEAPILQQQENGANDQRELPHSKSSSPRRLLSPMGSPTEQGGVEVRRDMSQSSVQHHLSQPVAKEPIEHVSSYFSPKTESAIKQAEEAGLDIVGSISSLTSLNYESAAPLTSRAQNVVNEAELEASKFDGDGVEDIVEDPSANDDLKVSAVPLWKKALGWPAQPKAKKSPQERTDVERDIIDESGEDKERVRVFEPIEVDQDKEVSKSPIEESRSVKEGILESPSKITTPLVSSAVVDITKSASNLKSSMIDGAIGEPEPSPTNPTNDIAAKPKRRKEKRKKKASKGPTPLNSALPENDKMASPAVVAEVTNVRNEMIERDIGQATIEDTPQGLLTPNLENDKALPPSVPDSYPAPAPAADVVTGKKKKKTKKKKRSKKMKKSEKQTLNVNIQAIPDSTGVPSETVEVLPADGPIDRIEEACDPTVADPSMDPASCEKERIEAPSDGEKAEDVSMKSEPNRVSPSDMSKSNQLSDNKAVVIADSAEEVRRTSPPRSRRIPSKLARRKKRIARLVGVLDHDSVANSSQGGEESHVPWWRGKRAPTPLSVESNEFDNRLRVSAVSDEDVRDDNSDSALSPKRSTVPPKVSEGRSSYPRPPRPQARSQLVAKVESSAVSTADDDDQMTRRSQIKAKIPTDKVSDGYGSFDDDLSDTFALKPNKNWNWGW